MHVKAAILAVSCVSALAPVAALANSIEKVAITPTPPVISSANVTITTDFRTTSGIGGFSSVVTKTASEVHVDIFVDLNLLTIIDSGTSIADVGTFDAGPVACSVALHTNFANPLGPPYVLQDSAACSFAVVTPVPGLRGPTLAILGALLVGGVAWWFRIC